MLPDLDHWGYFLGGIFSLAVAWGIFQFHFHRVHSALQKSEERFHAISTYTSDWEIWLGVDGHPLWVNSAASRMTGLTTEEALAMKDYPLPLVEEENRAAVRSTLAIVAEGGTIDDQLFRVRRPDTTSFSASLSAQQIFARDGRLFGTRLSIRDVSILIRYQESIDHKRILLQAVLDNARDGILALDQEFRVIFFNNRFIQLWGIDRAFLKEEPTIQDLIRETCRVGLYPVVAVEELIRRRIEQLMGGDDKIVLDTPRQDGRLVEAFASPLPGIGYLLTYRDVSERKSAELALRESESRYKRLFHEFETIFNGIPDSLSVWSAEMRVLWANKSSNIGSMEHKGEIIGLGCQELCMIDFAHKDDCEVWRCFRTGALEEGVHKTRDGRTWGVKAFPLQRADGAIDRVIRLASDLTERIVLREEAARAAHLAALGELAAGMAHEINNPTSLILLEMPILLEVFRDSIEILEEHFLIHGDFPCGGLRYSKMRIEVPAMLLEMLDGAERIKKIVEELKDFSHPTEANQFEAVDLNEAVRKALNLVGNQIKKATDHFTVTYAPVAAKSPGSRQRLEQVVINLVLNACQAMPDRDRRLTIAVGSWPERQRHFIRVIDTGVGILPEHLNLITDPFFTTRRAVGGTGLGLSVSTRIIEEHGGTLHFTSQVGEGTTVTIELPMLEEVKS